MTCAGHGFLYINDLLEMETGIESIYYLSCSLGLPILVLLKNLHPVQVEYI